jgi:hypothetical protein
VKLLESLLAANPALANLSSAAENLAK